MLNITITEYGFEMKGHAGYAPIGQDIVCAAISSLYLTYMMCAECEEIERDSIRELYAIERTHDNKVLHDAIARGMMRIAEQYPEFVKVDSLYPPAN